MCSATKRRKSWGVAFFVKTDSSGYTSSATTVAFVFEKLWFYPRVIMDEMQLFEVFGSGILFYFRLKFSSLKQKTKYFFIIFTNLVVCFLLLVQLGDISIFRIRFVVYVLPHPIYQ